jgi:nucleoside-diphosphate-sugar epimerase
MILLTGAGGQIGIDLVQALRQRHGPGAVVSTDVHKQSGHRLDGVEYAVVDVTDRDGLASLVDRFEPHTILHLAGILSAKGEQHPDLCWDVNVGGIRNVLDAARERPGTRVFWPSSIAVFGPNTPRDDTPQFTVTDPQTIYGASKVAGELLSQFYARRFDVDVRSVRYPGVISHAAPPGGGTTDWSVEMIEYAVRGEPYTCFVSDDTRMPMMYMPDAIDAVLHLMDADSDDLGVRTSYNIASFSLTPAELAETIRRFIPSFEYCAEPDYRQQIADSWPRSIDDAAARRDWGWNPSHDLSSTVRDMLTALAESHGRRDLLETLRSG